MKTAEQKLTDRLHVMSARMWTDLGDDWIEEQWLVDSIVEAIESGRLKITE